MPYKDPAKAKEAKRKWEEKNRKGKRHEGWLAIFYEEDCPGWEQELEELGIPCLVSPLHDRDTWTEHDEKKWGSRGVTAGTKKKPHRHLVAQYPNPVDYDTFRRDFAFLGGVSQEFERGLCHVKYARTIPGSTLYLAHETAECRKLHKAPYDPTLILEFCGASYAEWKSAAVDLHACMKEMREFIREHNVTEFADFQDWCDTENDEWSRLLDLNCAWAIGNYIDRRRSKLQQQARIARAAVSQQAEED